MDKQEARSILAEQLAAYRKRSYTDLVAMIGRGEHFEVIGPSGMWYQVEVEVFWDHKPDRAVRVMGAIDDGGIRAFVPLTDSFIMAPDGTFV